MIKDIAVLLPYKEHYTKNLAGAASIWSKDYINYFFQNLKVHMQFHYSKLM